MLLSLRHLRKQIVKMGHSNFCTIFKNHFLIMSHEKFKTLYFYFRMACNYQTWHNGDLG